MLMNVLIKNICYKTLLKTIEHLLGVGGLEPASDPVSFAFFPINITNFRIEYKISNFLLCNFLPFALTFPFFAAGDSTGSGGSTTKLYTSKINIYYQGMYVSIDTFF